MQIQIQAFWNKQLTLLTAYGLFEELKYLEQTWATIRRTWKLYKGSPWLDGGCEPKTLLQGKSANHCPNWKYTCFVHL